MQFKNITILHTESPDLEKLEEQLANYQFTPCMSHDVRTEGFSKLAVNDQFTFVADQRALFNYTIETKTVPSSLRKLKLEERCAEFEKASGYRPGKKAKKELREEVEDLLLASALPTRKTIQVVISKMAKLILIDTASASVADAIVKALLKVTEIPLSYGGTEIKPTDAMTARLLETEDDDQVNLMDFDLNDAAETESLNEAGTIVRYKNLSLESNEVVSTLQTGARKVTKLALLWQGIVAFTLTSDGQIRSVKYSDSFKNEIKCDDGQDDFGSTFFLYMSKIDDMVVELIENLGGLTEGK